jgi:hypothetical protein
VRSFAVVAVLCASSIAVADEAPIKCPLMTDDALLTLDEAWPSVPDDHGKSLEDRIEDKASDYGNHVGSRMEELSHHVARLHVDVRQHRAYLHLGYGDIVNFDSSWLFADGKAYVQAKLELQLDGHHWELKLPDMDVSRDSYRNDSFTEVNVSVLEKRF